MKGGRGGDRRVKYSAAQQSTRGSAAKRTIYCLGWHLDKEENEEEKSGFSSPSFNSSFDDAIAETERGAETATGVS